MRTIHRERLVRIERIAISGLRSFGPAVQTIELSPSLTVIYADNSQGKTSLAESLEFLLTGTISRRSFTGSATKEFAECLRNVHLADGSVPFVQLVLSDARQRSRTVTRRLQSDFTATRECASELEIDGGLVPDVSGVFRLSEPPLQTPILLQHSLRYVLSAKPQDRTTYFKAILDIADLDRLHALVRASATGMDLSPSPLLQSAVTAGIVVINSRTSPAATPDSIRRVILGFLRDHFSMEASISDTDVETVARTALRTAEEAEFPFGDISLPVSNRPQLEMEAHDVLVRSAVVCARASAADAAIQRLYEATLELPLATATAEADCPLCLSTGTITQVRIAQIRESLTQSSEIRQARREFDTKRAQIRDWLQALARDAGVALIAALQPAKSNEVMERVSEFVVRNLSDETASALVAEWRSRVSGLLRAHAALIGARAAAEEKLQVLEAEERSAAELVLTLDALHVSLSDLAREEGEYRSGIQPILDGVRESMAAREALRTPRVLLELLSRAGEIAHEHARHLHLTTRAAEILGAAGSIETAARQVLDEKFTELSGEIESWWNMMRPAEASAFSGLQRAGSGRRFLDIKAGLGAEPGDAARVERDAVAVFSDSQLNCLGLSAFLARVCRDGSSVVVLDDPIQASDEEHRHTFIRHVPAALIARGMQVVILTHDQRFARDLLDVHGHLAPMNWQIVLADPRVGSVTSIVKDSLQIQLEHARPLASSTDLAARRRAAQLLRNATERFCKKIMVNARRAAGDESALLSNYDGQTLAPLIASSSPYLQRSHADVGKLRAVANGLNPGNHDDYVPSSAALTMCHGDLKRLATDYL